ncbi:MAG: hypothetical protein CMJ32_01275 [Phycisphaerae bacterium]|nr:hypothetical protein [Phycisphaerae bacterium]
MVGDSTEFWRQTVLETVLITALAHLHQDPPTVPCSHEEMIRQIDTMQQSHGNHVDIQLLGTSLHGLSIPLITIVHDGPVAAEDRPALLIVGGLDSTHPASSRFVMDIAKELAASDDCPILAERTVYLVPRANPDAYEWMRQSPVNRGTNARSIDEDRDREFDEDGPDDLNGDGVITRMRVFDPDKADRMEDPEESRLDKKPDPSKSERAEFYVTSEGIDNDGDGQLNEDPPGGVNLDMNFMHNYPYHDDLSGRWQLSEPESHALANFLLDHPRIITVMTYGIHDNLARKPSESGQNKSGVPNTLDAKDVDFYTTISDRYIEITGYAPAPTVGTDGSFHGWVYAQLGMPSFTTPGWNMPTKGKSKDKQAPADQPGNDAKADANSLTPSPVGDISMETLTELMEYAQSQGMQVDETRMSRLTVEMVENYSKMAGIEVRRIKTAEPAQATKTSKKEKSPWLEYIDEQRDGEGFVQWQWHDHPEYGRVQIGGWIPGYRMTPPEEEFDEVARKQAAFLVQLMDLYPRLELEDLQVKRLSRNIYEVEATLVNDGFMPAGTAMASKNRRSRPHVVRIGVDKESIVSGTPVHKTWTVPGSGGRNKYRWIIEHPDGEPIQVSVYSEKFGSLSQSHQTSELKEQGQ